MHISIWIDWSLSTQYEWKSNRPHINLKYDFKYWWFYSTAYSACTSNSREKKKVKMMRLWRLLWHLISKTFHDCGKFIIFAQLTIDFLRIQNEKWENSRLTSISSSNRLKIDLNKYQFLFMTPLFNLNATWNSHVFIRFLVFFHFTWIQMKYLRTNL